MAYQWLSLLSGGVGSVLVASGTLKIADRESFAMSLSGRSLPRGLRRALESALAPAEILIGVSVLLGIWPLVSSSLALLLTIGFVLYQAASRRYGYAGCRCFGVLDEGEVGSVALLRALGLCVAATALTITLAMRSFVVVSPLSETWLSSTALGAAAAAASLVSLRLISEIKAFNDKRPRFLKITAEEST